MSHGSPQEVRRHHSFESAKILLLHSRQMDEILLEGQEGSGQLILYIVFKRHADKALSYSFAAEL
jgi:hypothetical protein